MTKYPSSLRRRTRRYNGYGRALFLIAALLAGLLLGGAGLYTHWRSQRLLLLESASSLTLLPQGLMEYAERGNGPVALVIHGSPGGYDQGLVYGEELIRRGFQVIAVSRPGYLRTPLLTGVTIEEQAEAIDSLLSTLGITKCSVLGVAEGAPSALQLAWRHPERITSLVLLSPQSASLDYAPIASLGYRLFHDLTGDLGCWYLSLWLKANPASLFEQAILFGSTLRPSRAQALAQDALRDPPQRNFLSGLITSITPLTCREAGIINDNAQLKDLTPIAQMRITAPLLVITGEEEKQALHEGCRKLVSSVPGASLSVIPRNGHIAPIGREFGLTWDRIAQFLKTPQPLLQGPPPNR